MCCFQIENHDNKGKGNRRTRKKRACETAQQPKAVKKSGEGQVNKRVSCRAEHQDDEKRGRAPVSNSSGKVQRLQPRSCSVSDQVANVRHGIVEALNTVRQCRTELEKREQNLEASLQAVDALGMFLNQDLSVFLETNFVRLRFLMF